MRKSLFVHHFIHSSESCCGKTEFVFQHLVFSELLWCKKIHTFEYSRLLCPHSTFPRRFWPQVWQGLKAQYPPCQAEASGCHQPGFFLSFRGEPSMKFTGLTRPSKHLTQPYLLSLSKGIRTHALFCSFEPIYGSPPVTVLSVDVLGGLR